MPVVLGVSGGADSVCLVHALLQVAAAWGLALHVAHVNHALRPQAARDAEFVASLAARWELAFHLTILDPTALRADRTGLEASARHARYTFLCRVARQVTPPGLLPCVAVAHHANDQAETVLLRLVGGSGLRGLASLRPLSSAPVPVPAGEEPVRLVRPLLGVSRDEIMAYLQRHGLEWIDDESNDDLHFARNRLRHRVLPELAAINPSIIATLGRSAGLWAEEAARLEALDAAALDRLLIEHAESTRIVVDLNAWQMLPAADRRGVLRAAFDRLGADARQLGFSHLDAMVQALDPQGKGLGVHASGPHSLPGGLAWSVAGATAQRPACLYLHFVSVPPVDGAQPYLDAGWRSTHHALPLPIPGEVRAGAWRLAATVSDAAELPAGWEAECGPWRLFACAEAVRDAVLTSPHPGLRVQPLGMGGKHRRLVDLFRSHKIVLSLRQGWPILVDCRDGQVLWVCGLQPAETLRITAQTRQVVLLEWLPAESRDAG